MKSKIRNFQIQTRLGSGSYGVIFKAINKTDQSACVLKQIRMNKMSQKAKKSTLNQATIMGKLIHPFIVQYKDSFVEDDTLHIVMQYCDNGDLSMYLKMQNKKPLKQQKIWKFFLQICLGLQFIHKNKILHRDIKSLNIFLNKNEDIKIGDLGVAKMLMANDFAQTVVGTPFYLSPQLCQQKPYNQKSDVWALGCLLYELCTYKHPFEAANQASLILKIIRGKYNPIPQFYSKQLKDVIDMCLQRDYKRRPTASMILQKPKLKELIKELRLEQKIKEEYQRMRNNKQNKQPIQKAVQNSQFKRPIIPCKGADKKGNKQVVDNNFLKQDEKVKILNAKNYILKPQSELQKIQEQKKLQINLEKQVILQKKPSISGMPQNNIILPDKEKIKQKLQGNNMPLLQKKEPANISVNKQIQRKSKQNKQQFIKNLEFAIDQHINQRKSPITQKKNKNKEQEISTSIIFQQKSRLQKIDMKIQEQLKRQHEVQKEKLIQERNKSQTPSLIPSKSQDKNFLSNDRKSVPALISKQSNKQANRYQKGVNKKQNPLIPPLPPKNKQQIIKVKMQQPQVQAKVYESNKSSQIKHKGVIKSRGFAQELQQQTPYISKQKKQLKQRKSTQNITKPVLFGTQQNQIQKFSQYHKRDLSNKQISQPINKSSQYHSERNIKLLQEEGGVSISRIEQKKQPERYLFKKKPGVNASSRVRKGSSSNEMSRNAKNVSKYKEVTKEDEDVVMNLPDRLKDNEDSSDDEGSRKKEIQMNRGFELKGINNEMVLQKYEQILSSNSIRDVKSIKEDVRQNSLNNEKDNFQEELRMKDEENRAIKINKNLNEYDEEEQNSKYSHPQQKISDQEFNSLLNMNQSSPITNFKDQNYQNQQIQENESLALKNQYDEEDETEEILDQSEELIECQEKQIQYYNDQHVHNEFDIEEQIYEVNNFNLNKQDIQLASNPSKQFINFNQGAQNANTLLYNQSKSQWSFDQQPELPMLQDKQSPFFQEANPYLMFQQYEETIQQKRNFLQIRLQQNIKRQDQINKLMQIKIQQCKAMVPKHFDEILSFFRAKINKQDEYTQNDEKQIQQFLRRKGLTDQRKFQNIYKIMHFEMQLQNTRKIIQRICKKLGQLQQGTATE